MRLAQRGRGGAKLYVDGPDNRELEADAARCASTRYETLPDACPHCHAGAPAWACGDMLGHCRICGATAFVGGPVRVRTQRNVINPGGRPR